jgi:anti-sigma regulatory factor (Ser/Thr protein kinase)
MSESPQMDHAALVYGGIDGFVGAAVPFVKSGLEADEVVVAALDASLLDALRDQLGPDGRSVQYRDTADLGRNPGRILGVWHRVATEAGSRPCRGLSGTLGAGRDEAETLECELHEALLNTALAHLNLRLLCTYDTAGLAPEVVDRAGITHPFLVSERGREQSGRYSSDALVDEVHGGVLAAPPAEALAFEIREGGLADVRRFVHSEAHRAGLGRRSSEELVLAVNELATNSLRHGGGQGLLRIWQEGIHVVCEVVDAGRINDPLLGRVPPRQGGTGGRGLWLVHQLCDLVQLRSGPAGTTVRMRKRVES